MESSIPLSEYASKLEEHVKQRYLQKISSIGVDPALIEGKLKLRTRQPDCLPSVESIDLLFYLVLKTSFYEQQQFKAFRSLQAYNQMVSGFIASVQGHPCRQVCCFGQNATLYAYSTRETIVLITVRFKIQGRNAQLFSLQPSSASSAGLLVIEGMTVEVEVT